MVMARYASAEEIAAVVGRPVVGAVLGPTATVVVGKVVVVVVVCMVVGPDVVAMLLVGTVLVLVVVGRVVVVVVDCIVVGPVVVCMVVVGDVVVVLVVGKVVVVVVVCAVVVGSVVVGTVVVEPQGPSVAPWARSAGTACSSTSIVCPLWHMVTLCPFPESSA